MSGLFLPDRTLLLPREDWRDARDWRRPWRDKPGFSGCCCKSAPSSPAPNCFSACCGPQPSSTLHLTIGAQQTPNQGCSHATPVPGFDNQIVTMSLISQSSCIWKGDLICGSGVPPAGNCGGGASGCDGTNHFYFFCCTHPPCVSLSPAMLIAGAYTNNGNTITLNGTTIHYVTSWFMSGTCSPVNFTGTLNSGSTFGAAVCDNCSGFNFNNTQWPMTITL